LDPTAEACQEEKTKSKVIEEWDRAGLMGALRNNKLDLEGDGY